LNSFNEGLNYTTAFVKKENIQLVEKKEKLHLEIVKSEDAMVGCTRSENAMAAQFKTEQKLEVGSIVTAETAFQGSRNIAPKKSIFC
jgi:hypothetical protein